MRGTWRGSGTWQTSGGGGGGGGLILAVIAVAVLFGSGVAAAIVRALETILIVALCGVGGLVVLGVTWIVWQMHLDRAARPATAWPAYQVPPAAPEPLDSRSTAISPGLHLHFHGLAEDQMAAIIGQVLPVDQHPDGNHSERTAEWRGPLPPSPHRQGRMEREP